MENPCVNALFVLVMALGAGATACASAGAAPPMSPAATSITGAELAALAETPAAPEPREATAATAAAPASTEPPADLPNAKLVCRTQNRVDGTSELFLEWNGKVASGVIRRTAPSGMVYSQPVRAERYQGTIVVDEPNNEDLASHAAMVVDQNGKLHMRVGAPGQLVSPCE